MRKLFGKLRWQVTDFHPKSVGIADWEAYLRRLPKPDLVWVPCFRQRDIAAASRWANRRGVPLIFDPLISAYDKQVDERQKLHAHSPRAKRLLAWEKTLFQRANRIIADTPAHADYFNQVLGVSKEKISVVYVGADGALFRAAPPSRVDEDPLEILFYGSFIPLQAPKVVVEAARLYQGPAARWVMLGDGPLRQTCEHAAQGQSNIVFENWLPYEKLPARIHRADILLGVFGITPKADRVIPNKVYQALACGRPVITRSASAYPEFLRNADETGLVWTAAGDAQELADQVTRLATDHQQRHRLGHAAAATSQRYFAESQIEQQLAGALACLGF